MTFRTSIIAQATLAQRDKNILRGNYAGELCWSALSVVVIVDHFSDHAPVVSWHLGLRIDAVRVGRGRPTGAPVRRLMDEVWTKPAPNTGPVRVRCHPGTPAN
jgi:hypothetical protein